MASSVIANTSVEVEAISGEVAARDGGHAVVWANELNVSFRGVDCGVHDANKFKMPSCGVNYGVDDASKFDMSSCGADYGWTMQLGYLIRRDRWAI